jgi:DNA-directed RNA polymerase specialized sigma24 family protein
MRHVLCNRARDRRRQKRGGGVAPLRLGPGQDVAAPVELSDEQSEMLTALDDALEALQRVAARQARVVECRFFGGMSVEDTAAALDVSRARSSATGRSRGRGSAARCRSGWTSRADGGPVAESRMTRLITLFERALEVPPPSVPSSSRR